MKIIFMGTPAFAVPTLKALIANHNVLAVCTQPDRPAGRGHKLAHSPIKALAIEHHIPVLQPESLRLDASREIRTKLRNYGADIFVVVAYGLILPKGILNMPPLGCINIHGSLLPKYRGASPIHAALRNGDSETGITIQHMDIGVDTGDVILSKSLTISPTERFPDLHDRMADMGGELILEALSQLESSTAQRTPQDDALSSYAPLIHKSDGQINWAQTTAQIINQTRAFDPWPGCFTMKDGQPLKIWRAESINDQDLGNKTGIEIESKLPGTVLLADPSVGLCIKTGDGAALITELQALNGKRMPSTDFLRGRKIEVGKVFESK